MYNEDSTCSRVADQTHFFEKGATGCAQSTRVKSNCSASLGNYFRVLVVVKVDQHVYDHSVYMCVMYTFQLHLKMVVECNKLFQMALKYKNRK